MGFYGRGGEFVPPDLPMNWSMKVKIKQALVVFEMCKIMFFDGVLFYEGGSCPLSDNS